jgi:hypothetical protein
MQPDEVQTALAEAVEEVLGTMCFAPVFSSSEEAIAQTDDCPLFEAALHFEGVPSGEFRLRIPLKPARLIGSGFLGKEEDEISDSQAGEVVCELANMFCGSALSRIEAGATFHLSHPELVSPAPDVPFAPPGFARWFELEEGSLAASLSFQTAL